MIDEKLYNLTYIHKETLKEHKARMVGMSFIDIVENGEAVRYTIHNARKIYKGCKSNRGSKLKGQFRIANKYNPKKFKEYLESTSV